jgi:hypothetical protein
MEFPMIATPKSYDPAADSTTDSASFEDDRLDRAAGPGHAADAPPPRPLHRARKLFHNLRDDVVLLAKQELALAQSETQQNIAQIVRRLGNAGAYAAAVATGLVLFLFGVSIALGYALTQTGIEPGLSYALSFLAVGTLITLIAGLGLRAALKHLAHDDPVPTRTLRSLSETGRAVKTSI